MFISLTESTLTLLEKLQGKINIIFRYGGDNRQKDGNVTIYRIGKMFSYEHCANINSNQS
jgi:hypothetical protein